MNAIGQVLSIPEIKSEHPRLYSQALGELETMKGQAARIAELEARVKELKVALKAYETEHADNAHDEGVDAGMSFPPENCDCDNCSRARALLETK